MRRPQVAERVIGIDSRAFLYLELTLYILYSRNLGGNRHNINQFRIMSTEKSNSHLLGCSKSMLSIFGNLFLFILIMTFARKCGETTKDDIIQNNSETQLEWGLEDIQKELPIQVDEKTTIINLKMDEKYLHYYVELELTDLPLLKANKEKQKTMVLEDLRIKKAEMSPLINKLIKTNRGIIYHYFCKDRFTSTDVIITTAELKSLIK